MPLSLIAGPANAGKVGLLLDRYLDSLESEPVLIVPNRSDVDFVERELLARRPALLAGTIGTFDDVFERIARAGGEGRRALPTVQRAFVVRRAIGAAALNGLSTSAQSGGFADALLETIGELESGLLSPAIWTGCVAALRGLPRGARPARLVDRELLQRIAVRRLQSDLGVARRAGVRVRFGTAKRAVGAAQRSPRHRGGVRFL